MEGRGNEVVPLPLLATMKRDPLEVLGKSAGAVSRARVDA